MSELKKAIERRKKSLGKEKLFEDKMAPKVFLDVSIGGSEAGKIIIELRDDVVPRSGH